jgi:hypothetical protein
LRKLLLQLLANGAFAGAFAADNKPLLAGERHAIRRRFNEILGKVRIILGNVIAKESSEHKLFLLRVCNQMESRKGFCTATKRLRP